MNTPNDILVDFASPCGFFTLSFDDDGRVAYAYLKRGEVVVGDVWIYNRCPTPIEPEWKDRTKAPFANCKAYTKNEGYISRHVALNDIQIEWHYDDNQPNAYIYLFNQLVATVGVGDKPGYSRFAEKDGPLAKLLAISFNE